MFFLCIDEDSDSEKEEDEASHQQSVRYRVFPA